LVSFLDVSTGEFLTAQGNAEYIDKLLQNFNPSEVLIQKNNKIIFRETFGDDFHSFIWRIDLQRLCFETLTKHFQTASLKGFGIEELKEGIIASGAILYYLETQHNKVQHITAIQRIAEDAYVWMDRLLYAISNYIHSYNQMHLLYWM
jgi:DNA mismatch repair protein MutS